LNITSERVKSGLLRSVRKWAIRSGLSSLIGETRIAHRLRRMYYKKFPLPQVRLPGDPIVLKMQYPDDTDRFSVLLIQVPLPGNERHKRIIPLGISYLASYLIEKMPDVNVGILDAQVQSLNYWETVTKIAERKWDIVGIGYWAVQAQFARNVSLAIKSRCPDTVVVHGGVQPTAVPEEALESADYLVLHEGEVTFHELVKTLREGADPSTIRGLGYKKDGQVVRTVPREFLRDLDALPFPAWHLLPIEQYKMPLHVVGGERMPIIGSRGCPYECSFCSSPLMWKRRVRWRSPENVVAEMKEMVKQYGINYFHFWDDNLTLKPDFIRGVCELIIEEKLDVKWIGLDRAEHLNRHPELLELMNKAGCVGIEIGIESANPDTLLHIRKNQGINENHIALINQREAGLYPLYTCMAFNPGESITGYYLQREFLDEAQEGYNWYDYFHPFPFPLYMGQFCTPYPGTQLHEEAPDLGVVLLDDPEERFHHKINFVPNSLLEDVPTRTIHQLEAHHYYLYLLATWSAFYTEFGMRNTRDELAHRLHDSWRFLNAYFGRCEGRFTVRQLAVQLAEYLNFNFNKSVRLTAFTTYVLGQLGIVRSALYHTDLKIEPRCFDIPGNRKWQIVELLNDMGVTPKNMVVDFSLYPG